MPDEVGELKLLKYLSVQFSSLKKFPKNIGNLNNLEWLILIMNNDLTDSLTAELGSLKNVKKLQLWNNSITGSIPPEIFDAPNLEYLDLEYNEITGTIPKTIGNAKKLKRFSCVNCHLEGIIPKEVGDAVNLVYLALLNNDLYGDLPLSLLELENLESINISFNKFIFKDLLPFVLSDANTLEGFNFSYSHQDSIDSPLYPCLGLGETLSMSVSDTSEGNTYQWYKNDLPISGANKPVYTIEEATEDDYGTYYCELNNPALPKLTLYRRKIIINPVLADDTNKIQVKCKALLQGCFDTTTYLMQTQLADKQLLPLHQPFNKAPWNYEGTEALEEIPEGMVDWVLIEARNALIPSIVYEQKAALLMEGGQIVEAYLCMSGEAGDYGVFFSNLIEGEKYRFSIKTRHHLGVMTKQSFAVPNELSFDFSDPIQVQGGKSQLHDTERGFYALLAGDENSDGVISVDDFINYKNKAAELNQYLDADFNLDGSVTVTDFNLMLPNFGVIGVEEMRY